jgi:hypothetical protein
LEVNGGVIGAKDMARFGQIRKAGFSLGQRCQLTLAATRMMEKGGVISAA